MRNFFKKILPGFLASISMILAIGAASLVLIYEDIFNCKIIITFFVSFALMFTAVQIDNNISFKNIKKYIYFKLFISILPIIFAMSPVLMIYIFD